MIIYLISILIILVIIITENKKLILLWSIPILKLYLPLFSLTFFGQIFLLLVSVFDCIDGYAFVNDGIKCRTGLWFKYLSPIVIIALILHVFLSFLTNILYYKNIFIKSDSDLLKKNNSLPDIIFLFTKMMINIIFISDKNEESDHWIIIFFLIMLTGLNAYINIFYQNRINIILNTLNKTLSLILFLSFLTLFFGKIFKFIEFNGLMYLFLLEILIVIIYMLFNKKENFTFVLIDYTKINIYF